MAKIKTTRPINDDPQEWEPPNNYYKRERFPVVTFHDFQQLPNNIKTGLRNFRIQNQNALGRFGIWKDWSKIPPETRELYNLFQVGQAYKSDFMIYRQFIRAANSYGISYETGSDIINPSERAKIYGITNSQQWYYSPVEGYTLSSVDMLPNSGTSAFEVVQIRPPWMIREDTYRLNGYTIVYDDGETYRQATAEVSPVCRTIKSKRV